MADDTGVAVTINGRTIQAEPGELLIAAAERTGTHIPHFCYHPRMSSVGMCRMCLVEVDGPRGPSLQPSCMITVNDGMVVDTESEATKRAQEGILEFLLINHPLDCPVCDKGGECPLQDQTLAYGPGESRFVEEKRHYEKPIPISDLVHLDRERCILCDRCTRFADEVAGDALIHFTERGNATQVLTFPDDPFNSYFSGNTVQICPVGALTAAPYRFKARPWDLEQVESTCTGCSVGCRIAVQSSRNELVRYLGVDIDPVNHGWLCDRGRFGFQAVNSDDRITTPLVRDPSDDQQLIGTDWSTALSAAAEAISAAEATGIGIIGGARSTNEDAYAWSKLARTVIGTDNVDAQLADGLPADVVLGLPSATIDDACSATTTIVIAPDLKEELPVLYLRMKGAADKGAANIVEVSATTTTLTPHAARRIEARPGETATALAATLADDTDLARRLSEGSVVVVIGRASLAEDASAVVEAAGVIQQHAPHATFLPVVRRGNVRGALEMGMSPGLLPGRVDLDTGREWFEAAWGALPSSPGMDTRAMLEAAAAGRLRTLILVGADPLSDFPDRDLASRALAGAGTVIAVDTSPNASVRHADIVFPAAAFGEKGGTTTNFEGRVSRLAQLVTPPGTAREDWMIAAELAWRLGGDLGVTSSEDLWSEIEATAPSHAGCTVELIASPAARDGIMLPVPVESVPPVSDEEMSDGDGSDEGDDGGAGSQAAGEAPGGEEASATAAEPTRPDRPELLVAELPGLSDAPALDAYGLRLVSDRKLYDAATLTQSSPSMAGLAPEAVLRMNPGDMERLGVLSGDRVNVTSTRSTVAIVCRADEGVPRGSAAMPFNQPGQPANVLIDASSRVTDIRVETR